MTNSSEAFRGLRVALRESQDSGQLPCDTEVSRCFQVMISEVAVPVLRELVTLLCLEGLPTHLIMGMDEPVPYVGIQLDQPETSLWLYPSTTSPEVLSKVQGGLYPEYSSLRALHYRMLLPSALESVLIEQLRLVLCPPQPVI